jgi:hypothetical protein
MMAERASKSDQLRTFREERVLAAERTKAASEAQEIRSAESAALKKFGHDE